jgi:hypothetical protein
LIDSLERGEAENIQNSSPLPIDFTSPSPYIDEVTQASLIAELEAKVKHYRERMEHHRSELRIWESALQSALAEIGENKSANKKASQVKGKVSRAFVREVLKRNAKSGVTPKQFREAADQQGLSYPANFPHTTLHKFRTQPKPEVREEGGKYFPIPPD